MANHAQVKSKREKHSLTEERGDAEGLWRTESVRGNRETSVVAFQRLILTVFHWVNVCWVRRRSFFLLLEWSRKTSCCWRRHVWLFQFEIIDNEGQSVRVSLETLPNLIYLRFLFINLHSVDAVKIKGLKRQCYKHFKTNKMENFQKNIT